MTDKYNDEIIEEENQDTDDQTDDSVPSVTVPRVRQER